MNYDIPTDHVQRSDLARTTADGKLLNILCTDLDQNVIEAVCRNPNTEEWALLHILQRDDRIFETPMVTMALYERGYIDENNEVVRRQKVYDTLKNSFCPIPWNHISVQQNGDYRACCQMIYPPFGKFKSKKGLTHGVNYSVHNSDADDFRQSPPMMSIRAEMLKGERPDICKYCWEEEDSGIRSKRKYTNSEYPHAMMAAYENTKEDGYILDLDKVPLEYYDLRLGNKCNLACRSCGPGDSDQWIEDYAKLDGGEDAELVDFNYYGEKKYSALKNTKTKKWQLLTNDFNWATQTDFLKTVEENPATNRLYFTGGEPTVVKEHIDLVERLVEQGKAKDIVLEYNSNMTGIPKRLMSAWPHFKRIQIGFSIDGMNEQFEYLRYPGRWAAVQKTVRQANKLIEADTNLVASLTPTVSVYNVLHMQKLMTWCFEELPDWFIKTMPCHILKGPAFMNLNVLPYDVRQPIADSWEEFALQLGTKYGHPGEVSQNEWRGLIDQLRDKDNIGDLTKFLHESDRMDVIRGTNWRTTFPEIAEVIDGL